MSTHNHRWLHSERHRCMVAWHWRTDLAGRPCDSWTTWCIHHAQFPHWKRRQVSIDQGSWVSLGERSVKVWLVSITSQVQIKEGNLLAPQRRLGSPCTYPYPMMIPSSLPSNSLATGWSQAKKLVDGELSEEMRPIEKFVWSVYRSVDATTIPALHWELFKSRNLEGEKLPPTISILMPHILRREGDKSYTTPHPCLLPLEEMSLQTSTSWCVGTDQMWLQYISQGVTAHARRTSSPALLSANADSDCSTLPEYRNEMKM